MGNPNSIGEVPAKGSLALVADMLSLAAAGRGAGNHNHLAKGGFSLMPFLFIGT